MKNYYALLALSAFGLCFQPMAANSAPDTPTAAVQSNLVAQPGQKCVGVKADGSTQIIDCPQGVEIDGTATVDEAGVIKTSAGKILQQPIVTLAGNSGYAGGIQTAVVTTTSAPVTATTVATSGYTPQTADLSAPYSVPSGARAGQMFLTTDGTCFGVTKTGAAMPSGCPESPTAEYPGIYKHPNNRECYTLSNVGVFEAMDCPTGMIPNAPESGPGSGKGGGVSPVRGADAENLCTYVHEDGVSYHVDVCTDGATFKGVPAGYDPATGTTPVAGTPAQTAAGGGGGGGGGGSSPDTSQSDAEKYNNMPKPVAQGVSEGKSYGSCGPGATNAGAQTILTMPGAPKGTATDSVIDSLLNCTYDMFQYGGQPTKAQARNIVGRNWVGDIKYTGNDGKCYHADITAIKEIPCKEDKPYPVLPNGSLPYMDDVKFDFKAAEAKCYRTIGDIKCGQYGISGERMCGTSTAQTSAAYIDDPSTRNPADPTALANGYKGSHPDQAPISFTQNYIGKNLVSNFDYKDTDGQCYHKDWNGTNSIPCAANTPLAPGGRVSPADTEFDFIAANATCIHVTGDLTAMYGAPTPIACGLLSGRLPLLKCTDKMPEPISENVDAMVFSSGDPGAAAGDPSTWSQNSKDSAWGSKIKPTDSKVKQLETTKPPKSTSSSAGTPKESATKTPAVTETKAKQKKSRTASKCEVTVTKTKTCKPGVPCVVTKTVKGGSDGAGGCKQ